MNVPKPAARQSPLVQVRHDLRAAPAGREEADHGDDEEEDEDDREYDGVDVAHPVTSASLPIAPVGSCSLRCKRVTTQSTMATAGM